MPEYKIRPMKETELGFYYNHITQDFPEGEYAPYEILCRQYRDGLQEGLIFYKGDQKLAYAICAASIDYVLISLFAVHTEFRGQGVGSAFLQSLTKYYSDRKAILVEVERPELASELEEINLRKWRIQFYENAGFFLIKGVDYIIWDVPMHLMALPLISTRKALSEEIQSIMYQIYFQLMGKHFMHKLIIRAQ